MEMNLWDPHVVKQKFRERERNLEGKREIEWWRSKKHIMAVWSPWKECSKSPFFIGVEQYYHQGQFLGYNINSFKITSENVLYILLRECVTDLVTCLSRGKEVEFRLFFLLIWIDC